MFQQGRRIQEISGRSGSFRTLATLQCQSYLAAANALSLVATEHAWIAVVPVEDGSDRVRGWWTESCMHALTNRLVQSNKRRKISYEIPEEEFAPSASRAPEIIELADIRREYTVALSRLQLSADFPELERTSELPAIEGVFCVLTICTNQTFLSNQMQSSHSSRRPMPSIKPSSPREH